MGTVFKKSITRPLPSVVEIIEKNGQRFARYRVRGKLRTTPLTTGTNGQARAAIESPYYVAKYRDSKGVVQTVPTGCRDEQAALQVLAGLERNAEFIRSGVITTEEVATAIHHSTPIESHFATFESRQQARGVSKVDHHNTMQALRRVASDCKIRFLADLRCGPFEKWLNLRTAEMMCVTTRTGYREA